MFKILSEEEIEQLSNDILSGKVFGNWNITDEYIHLIVAFLPAFFKMESEINDQIYDQIGIMYEYYDNAIRFSQNIPQFDTVNLLNPEQSKQLTTIMIKKINSGISKICFDCKNLEICSKGNDFDDVLKNKCLHQKVGVC